MEVVEEIEFLRSQLEDERRRRISAEQLIEQNLLLKSGSFYTSAPLLESSFLKAYGYAVLVVNSSNEVVFLNDLFCHLFHLPKSSDEYIYTDASSFRALCFSSLNSAYSSSNNRKNIEKYPSSLHLPNGRICVLEEKEIEYASGAYGTALLYREDNNQNRSEREGQDLFNKIVRTVPNLIYVYDSASRTEIYLNDQVLQILGYDPCDIEAINGKFFATIVCEEERQKLEFHTAQMLRARDGEVAEVELRVKDKAGNIRWINCRETVYHRNYKQEVQQVIGSAKDITERKLHQQELALLKESYETILDNIPSDIVVFDKELRFKYVNPTGFKDEEVRNWVIGKTQEEYGAFRNLDIDLIHTRAMYLQQALEQKKVIEFEETFQSREGETLHFIRKLKPIVDEKGQVTFTVSNGINITDLKKAQQQITASEAKNRAILAAVPDLVLIISKEGKFLEVSNTNKVLTEVQENELVGNTIGAVLPSLLAEEFFYKINHVLQTGLPSTIEYSIDTEEGLRYREGRIVKYENESVVTFLRDTTEQKRNEHLIKEQNELIRQVMNTSSNLIFVKSKSGKYTFVNPAFAEHFGSHADNIINKTDVELNFEQEEIKNFLEKDSLVFNTLEPQSFEEKVTNNKGDKVWLKTIKKPLFLASGEVHVLGISTDITAEKKANEKLLQREELYRLLSENSKDLICLHEVDGTYLYVSKAVEELLGYSQEELIGTSPAALCHSDDVPFLQEQKDEKILHLKENTLLPHRLLHKNGSYIWVETHIKPILNEKGEVFKLQSTSRDITERIQANEALLINEKKYKDLVQYSQAYILSHDMQGEITSINAYSLQALDYLEKEVVGKSLKEFLAPDHRSSIDTYLEHLQNNVSFQDIFTVFDKNKEPRYLQFSCYKVETPGSDTYVIAIGYDLTDRLLMEEELKRAKEAAEGSAKIKESFLANMSHEIRTPLNGILGMSNLLRKTKLDEQQKNYLNIISSSSDNLLVIINDILDTAKIEAGKMDIEHTPFDIYEAVNFAFNNLQYKAEAKGITYLLESLPSNITTLVGDPHRLQQVLINLLNNAIKFTEEGSVRLCVNLVEENSETVTLEFAVRDTGIGIPEAKLNDIFESFTQAYTNTSRLYGGTGLGLNICRNLIELQGGRIWVDSIENVGSIFKFILTYPKSKEKRTTFDGVKIDYSSLGHLRVLLAEDNEVNVYLAKSILEGWGTKVDVAWNGEEAVTLASGKNYDVVLMDIQMPLLNGLEATQKIRKLSDKVKAQVPIIALTANAIKGDAEKYMSYGMNDYISKPFHEDQLFLDLASQLHKDRSIISLSQAEQSPQEKETSNNISEPLYDLQMVLKMTKGDTEFLNRTKKLIIITIPPIVMKMQHTLEEQDWNGLSGAAHSLKSTIELLKISRLQKIIKEIELDAKHLRNLKDLKSKINIVADVISQVVDEFKNEVQYMNQE